ncbi:ankyrin repeat [Brachionus plicatilis]|uniref:Ankyrin repeat n=1 Tax=Brachionus plicatilis TaxID=10195 RepID=A0A3M7P5A7_BRAPC|nr:ankyrin repeat [Brachionus plicatilis]
MKPKYEVNRKKMTLDLPNQKSKLDNKISNVSETRNEILKLLNPKERNLKALKDLNNLLGSQHNMPFILNLNDGKVDGSFLHYLTINTQAGDEISWRMVYSLSNAGIDINMQDSKGNTALHLAYMKGYAEIGFEFIEALLKLSPDFRIMNNNGKIAMDYMEDLEQLRCMYEAHYPDVWAAADKSDINIFYRLINGFVKMNTFKNGIKLSSYVRDKCGRNKGNILNLIEKYDEIIDFVHSIYALDFKLMSNLAKLIKDKFDPNIADFSYCFSWFKPFCRNIPKFLLEIGIETKQIEFVRFLLSNGSDVNLPNSKTGNPLYFCAFNPQFAEIKQEILSNANLNVKNHNGQSVLFYLVELFLSENVEDRNGLLQSFIEILHRYPMLLTHRDQDESTLIEEILSKNPTDFKKSKVFLKEISNFILMLLEKRNFKVFQDMFYQSYGLVLLSTPIYLSSSNDFETISFEDYIETYNLKEIKIYLKKIIDSNFVDNKKIILSCGLETIREDRVFIWRAYMANRTSSIPRQALYAFN